ncbi:MAG: hypothetical protein K0R54_4576 [Clostridiaceae bacterium]|nr:hypothetical protein [Clostridiaceae bacterium]
MKQNFFKNIKHMIILLNTMLFMLIVTSCTVNDTDAINNPEKETDNSSEIIESEKNQEESEGIVVDGELRHYDGELVNTAKQLIKNSLISNDIAIGIGFPIDLEDNIENEDFNSYCKVYDNEYGFNSTKDIEQFLSATYSNEDIIYKTIHMGDIPIFKDFEGHLYANDAIHSASRAYVIKDWFNIYATEVTENTAVINYPLYYFRDGLNGVKMYRNTISKVEEVWLLDDILEAELIELDEATKKTLGMRSVAIEIIDSLKLTEFIRIEGKSIEQEGAKYTNIGYSSDTAQYESYTIENLSAYCQNYTSSIYNMLMPYFEEIDGKLYVRNIEYIRKEYTRTYKMETLEVLDVSDIEASLKIKYLDWSNQEKTLQFNVYPDTEIYWRWLSDTII